MHFAVWIFHWQSRFLFENVQKRNRKLWQLWVRIPELLPRFLKQLKQHWFKLLVLHMGKLFRFYQKSLHLMLPYSAKLPILPQCLCLWMVLTRLYPRTQRLVQDLLNQKLPVLPFWKLKWSLWQLQLRPRFQYDFQDMRALRRFLPRMRWMWIELRLPW